ncbi:MAG TPA: molybdopterin-binding/glycosyltransferase family 2 protein [Alphaproteobacteria bacterium]
MKFGEIPVADAEGAILAHSIRLGSVNLKKGRVLSRDDVEALTRAGHAAVTAARLEPGDVPEDEAAANVAAAVAGDNLTIGAAFTGRANLYASVRGVAVIDAARIERMNLADEAITVATVPPFALVEPRQMVATIKIIPFAAPESAVAACQAIAAEARPLIRVAPLQRKSVGLVQTRLPGLKPKVFENTVNATRARLAALGSELVADRVCDHSHDAVVAAVAELRDRCDLILILGASAIVDRRDVIPSAIVSSGGEILHFGMPVDPGNLLLLGRVGALPVVGLPGCARSPKLNGFDWVLQRLLADLPVSATEIMRMGVGGLLMEIATRPLPRQEASPEPAAAIPRAPRIAAIVLAAGRSSRMQGANKLLAEIDGRPMVERALNAALGSQARPVIVVTGHDGTRVRAALAGRDVPIVDNPNYAEGLATSIRAGLAALPADIDGAIFLLADMPRVNSAHIDRLIAAFNPVEGRAVCIPTYRAKRGNPILWAARFFTELRNLSGDHGARVLLGQHADLTVDVEMPDDGVLIDVDTPETLAAIQADAKAPA